MREEDGLRHVLVTTAHKTIYILKSIQQSCRLGYNFIRPYCTVQSIRQHKYTIFKTFLTVIGLKLYHRALLYLHELLHAGPILIILTLFTILYTIGLGDNTGASSGVPSAYSVFNRGMRRILGTVDAEELARQYAGGAAAAAMGGGNNNNNGDQWGGDRGVWVPNDDEDDVEDENRLRNERRRQRRLERLQRRNDNQENDAQGDNNNNDDSNVNEQLNNDDAGNDLNDTNIQQLDASTQAAVGNNAGSNNTVGGRKTGKKARRRNLELRREMQRQRQAAAANGFGRGDGDDDVAMDRLIGDVAD